MATTDAVAAVARQHRTRTVRPKLVLSVWIGADVRQRMTVRLLLSWRGDSNSRAEAVYCADKQTRNKLLQTAALMGRKRHPAACATKTTTSPARKLGRPQQKCTLPLRAPQM